MPESKLARSSSEFPTLLRRIADEVPDLVRLRYTSPHPRHVTPALIAAHADLELLPAHVHLPVQSGSNRVLRRMARRYTPEQYIARADALRAAKPGLTLSTDFIVGFPGETEDDFQQTLALVRRVGFVAAFAFKYSPRPHTPALKLGDEVPEELKDDRLARLFALVEQQQQRHLQSRVGRQVEVLVEGRSPGDTGRFAGRSERNEIVHLMAPPGQDPTGELVAVTIDEAFRHSLGGYMTGAEGREEARKRTRLSVIGAGGSV
jgi:tRNA-2-methylthio-N6-dimethylallyladenosine synthase